MSLQGDCTLQLSPAGTLAFADSSLIEWEDGAQLVIEGELGKLSLRFGDSDEALSAAQIASIRYEGKKVVLDSGGYLHPLPRGTTILLR